MLFTTIRKKSKWLLSIEWYNRNNLKKEGGIKEQSPAKKKKEVGIKTISVVILHINRLSTKDLE